MLLKDNYDELISIAKTAHEKYNPSIHEFRSPIFFLHDGVDILSKHLLSRSELDEKIKQLQELKINNFFYFGETDLEKYQRFLDPIKKSITKNAAELLKYQKLTFDSDSHYLVQISANGNILFSYGRNGNYNMNDIEDPFLFFSQKIYDLQKQECDIYSYQQNDLLSTAEENINILSCLDEIIVYDNAFLCLRGWIYQKDSLKNESANVFLIFSFDNEQFILRTKNIARNDVASHLNNPSLCNSCFECLVSFDKIMIISQSHKEITIKAGFLCNGILIYNNMASITRGRSSPNGRHIGEITKNTVIKQTFLSNKNNLCAIQIMFATFARSNLSSVSLQLYDENDVLINKETIQSGTMIDNSYLRYKFPNINDSFGKKYTLVVSSNDAAPGNAVTIWCTNGNSFDGNLFINNQQQTDNLCIIPKYGNVLDLIIMENNISLEGDPQSIMDQADSESEKKYY